MGKKRATVEIRQCERCLQTFRGVDTRRSFRRHIREGRCHGEQVCRVQELLPPTDASRELAPTAAAPLMLEEISLLGRFLPAVLGAVQSEETDPEDIFEGLVSTDPRVPPLGLPPSDPASEDAGLPDALANWVTDVWDDEPRELSTPVPPPIDDDDQGRFSSSPWVPLPPSPLENDDGLGEVPPLPGPSVAVSEEVFDRDRDNDAYRELIRSLSAQVRLP